MDSSCEWNSVGPGLSLPRPKIGHLKPRREARLFSGLRQGPRRLSDCLPRAGPQRLPLAFGIDMRAADVQKLIAAETEKWAKVIKFSGAKPD